MSFESVLRLHTVFIKIFIQVCYCKKQINSNFPMYIILFIIEKTPTMLKLCSENHEVQPRGSTLIVFEHC